MSINNMFDGAAKTIGDATNLNKPSQVKLIKTGLVIGAIYFGTRYLQSLLGKK